jgi:hypothetical protein
VKNVYKLIKVIFVVFVLFFIVIGMFRGIMLNDDGYILEAARRVSLGQIPYRDFHLMYTPGSVLFLGIIFKIFGVSLLVERISMLLVGLIGCYFIVRLLNDYQKNIYLSILGALIYLVWGSLHINFAWPVMFVLPLSFIFLFFFQKAIKLKNNKMFYLSGVLALLILFFKQNFGVGILFVVLFSFVINKINIKNIFAFLGGYCSFVGLWLLYRFGL